MKIHVGHFFRAYPSHKLRLRHTLITLPITHSNTTKNKRPSYEFDVIEADGEVAGNYYPISSSISISDELADDSFTIIVDRGQAGGSLNSGQIDLMLHRRLTSRSVSGDRFLGEKLDEGSGINRSLQ